MRSLRRSGRFLRNLFRSREAIAREEHARLWGRTFAILGWAVHSSPGPERQNVRFRSTGGGLHRFPRSVASMQPADEGSLIAPACATNRCGRRTEKRRCGPIPSFLHRSFANIIESAVHETPVAMRVRSGEEASRMVPSLVVPRFWTASFLLILCSRLCPGGDAIIQTSTR